MLILAGQIQLGPYGAGVGQFATAAAAFSIVMTSVCAALGLYQRDEAAGKTFSRVTCTNQRGEVVAAATHILKVVADD